MRGRNKGIRRGDHLASQAQRLKCRQQRQRSVCKKRKVLYTQIFRQSLFQLLMKWSAVCQSFILPDLLQIRDKLFQRGQEWTGYVNFTHILPR